MPLKMTPVLGALMLVLATAAWPSPNVHTGLWETTIRTEMPGLPVGMPPFTYSSCIREDDLVPKTQQPGQECQLLENKIDGGEVTWRMHCTSESGEIQGSGRITYTGDSFSGQVVMDMSQAGQAVQMTQHMEGRRMGECP